MLQDAIVGSALEWPSEVYADGLAERTGIRAFEIVGRIAYADILSLDGRPRAAACPAPSVFRSTRRVAPPQRQLAREGWGICLEGATGR